MSLLRTRRRDNSVDGRRVATVRPRPEVRAWRSLLSLSGHASAHQARIQVRQIRTRRTQPHENQRFGESLLELKIRYSAAYSSELLAKEFRAPLTSPKLEPARGPSVGSVLE